jgi:hypothetical protein
MIRRVGHSRKNRRMDLKVLRFGSWSSAGYKRLWQRLFQVALAVLISTIALSASAATYYVSPSGNDSNPGTEAQPWRTIQKCANTINGGDTCIVKAGEYTENVTWSRSGVAGNVMEVRAAVRHQAVLNGRFNVTGNYVKVDGLKVVMQDGSQQGIRAPGDYIEIVNNHITPFSDNALGMNNAGIDIGGSYSLVDNNYVEKTCFGYVMSGTGHVFQNNEATELRKNGSCGDVDYMRFFGPDHIIRNNLFHGINMEEVGTAHVDCFQQFDNNGPQYAIQNVLIEGNYCSDAAQGIIMSGLYYQLNDNVVIRNNVITRVGAWCAVIKNSHNVHMFNNTCDSTGGIHGMWCRGNVGGSCEFKNNIIHTSNNSYYGVFEAATLIDGTPGAPGKNNLLFRPGFTITGFDNDIKNSDPLFVNREAGNYRLQVHSPAIGAALIIPQWQNPTDMEGTLRPQGDAWDIGAYEYHGKIPFSAEDIQILE